MSEPLIIDIHGLDAFIASMPAIKFRHHRGSLVESMKTVVELPATKKALLSYLKDHWKENYDVIDIKLTHTGYDGRVDWETWLVCVKTTTTDGWMAVGQTNGPATDSDQLTPRSDQLLQVDLDLYLVRDDVAFEQLQSLFPNAVVCHKDNTTTYPYVVKVADVVLNKDRFITLTYTPALEWVTAYKNIIATVLQSTTSKEEEE